MKTSVDEGQFKGVSSTGPMKLNLARQRAHNPPEGCYISPPPRVLRGPGDEVFLRFELIGNGATSKCYRVEQLHKSQLAMKVISRQSLDNDTNRRNLNREILITSRLKHARIVGFQSYFYDCSNVYICLELCPYGSLSQLIKSRKGLTEPEACFFMASIARGMEYLHQNLVLHRDIKPGNILLDIEMRPKIADFGLAVVLPNATSKVTSFAGTPCYMAPEVIVKPRSYGMPADVWGVGTVLYTMVFGRSPFAGRHITSIYRQVTRADFQFPSTKSYTEELESLICAILQLDPADRPSWSDILQHRWFTTNFVSRIPCNMYHTPMWSKPSNSAFHFERFMSQTENNLHISGDLYRDYCSKELYDPINLN